MSLGVLYGHSFVFVALTWLDFVVAQGQNEQLSAHLGLWPQSLKWLDFVVAQVVAENMARTRFGGKKSKKKERKKELG